MGRRILLALGTLGFVLIAYAVYNMTAGDKASVHETLTVGPDEADFAELEAQAAREVIESPDPEELQLTQGSGGEIVIFDPKTQERRLIFRAHEWKDVADNEYHMQSPTIRLLTPRGQIVEVRADEGQIVMDKRGKAYDPRSGWLKGNVIIFIDRTTPQWRHDNPDRAEMEQHRDQVVTMWLDDVSFDLDLSRLETPGAFRLQSKEADVEGEGLVLRWNQNQQRIEELQIARGKRMAMRGRQLAKFALPGSGDAEAVEPAAAAAPTLAMRPVRLVVAEETPPPDDGGAVNTRIALASAAEMSEPAVPEVVPESEAAIEDDGPRFIDGEEVLDLGAVAQRKPEAQRETVYEARFDGGVEVRQTESGEVSGRLLAELVELTFDFGSRQRDVLDMGPKPDEEEEEQFDAGTGIELTWGGLFRMEPVDRPVAPSAGNRFLVHAVGAPVRLEAGQGFATCDDFTFENESKRARLIGSDKQWVVVEGTSGDQISGARIMLDQKEGVARIDGAGSMRRPTRRDDSDDSRSVNIAWERGVDVRFGVIGGQEYLQEATFVGGVRVTQGADTSIDGDWVRAMFSPPKRKREAGGDGTLTLELNGNIERLDCREAVRLAQGDEEISCDKLLVDMGVDPAGEPFPEAANAWGNVRVKQGESRLEAGEHMFVRMELPDRRAQRAGRTAPQIVEMTGSGGVLAVDPGARLDVRAEEMACTFEGLNQLRTARIVGSASRPASVEKDDYRVRGPRVEIDAARPSLLVRGAGQLEFKSDRRLDGQQSEQPVPVTVSFTRQLDLRGHENVIHIDGDVEAISRDADEPGAFDFSRDGPRPTQEYTLACEHLEIGLADERRSANAADEAPAGPLDDVFGGSARTKATQGLLAVAWAERLFRPAGVPLAALSGVAALQAQAPARRPAPVSPARQTVQLKLAKRPVSVAAKDNAVASLSVIDPATRAVSSRMQITGPVITSDLVRQRMNVQGAGHMLIEDYRLPGAGARRPSGGVDPLLGDMGGSGPSQSLFSWENSLTYLRERRLGILDRSVEVIHRSGSEMAYAEQLARSRNLPAEAVRRMGGRRVQMTCDNMMIEFLNDLGGGGAASGAAALRRFQSTGNVHLQDGTKSIMGQRISYWQETEIVQVEGGAGEPARFFDADPATGHVRQQLRGEMLQWNRAARRVEVTKPTVLANRR